MAIRLIKPAEIDLEDRRFRFTFNPVEERFRRSVKEIGVLEPVIITYREGKPVLIDGWKRVEAARDCGLPELLALEIDNQANDLTIFLLTFFENYSRRPFSLAEKSLAVRKFRDFRLRPVDIIEDILPLLELPPEQKTLELMLELSSLGKWLEVIHRKDWKLGTAELLLSFPPEERFWLVRLVEKLSHNQQRELIELFYSLKRSTGKSLEELAGEGEIVNPVGRLFEGNIQAAAALLSVLRKLNWPTVWRLNQAISDRIRNLDLPPNISLDYDRTLENPVLKIGLEAESCQELKEVIKRLLETLGRPEWDGIFELLHHVGD
ncbi:MAG: hypothetical protein NUW07_05195 [Candidatus Saccharicenans sp.]|jgi:hypothetical protein|nr:hypothetical protein [Candidatus Saccharicenans sp.]MDH7492940.1 hypothetical protein [Candidatus Saccharicenans sp.]